MIPEYNNEQELIDSFYRKRVILFGSGRAANQVRYLPFPFQYCVDNNKHKWGQTFAGLPIYSPDRISVENKENIRVLIASMYYKEISHQLKEIGLTENVHFFNGVDLEESWTALIRPDIKQFQNVHSGRRAFLVGNGPSLTVEDLNRLTGEITFAANKIYLAFSVTRWRPTYYCIEDLLVAQNNGDIIPQLQLTNKFYSNNIKSFIGYDPSVHWLKMRDMVEGQEKFSTDVREYYYGGWTVMYLMLQIAFYMGIREVYLIGVDYKFDIPQDADNLMNEAGIEIVSAGERNHFHPEYRKPGEKWFSPALSKQKASFQYAKEIYEKHGGKVYNASRETALDVFPRVRFDDLFQRH